jgi:hypothetical protein
MGEDRYAGFVLHAGDQALAAARNDDVDGAVQARLAWRRRRHGRSSGTIWIACSGRPASSGPDEAFVDRLRRMERIRAAAQNHGIAGLEAQRAGIGRHVRAAFDR